MNLLLDTHVFIWFIGADKRLPGSLRECLQDHANSVFLSPVSIWEASVKYQQGKLALADDDPDFLAGQRVLHGFESLPLDEASVARLSSLPLLHRDPFDRMLICQAMAHGLTLVTSDEVILRYPVETLQAK